MTSKPYRQTTLDRYLLDVSELEPGETMYVLCDKNVSVADMQAALNVQYGPRKYKAHSHGSARYVTFKPFWGWDGSTEVNPCERPSGPRGANV